MSKSEIVRATLNPDGSLKLNSPARLSAGPVEVVLRPLPAAVETKEDWWQYLRRVRADAEAGRGPFRTEEEIERDRESVRGGDDRSGAPRR